MKEKNKKKVVIIGAGPAGLTAAYHLCKEDVESIVLEKDDVVGGISRTVDYKGYLFDIGGHRFFTKVKAVDDMWREVLAKEDYLRRGRLSRIYYNKKFFNYPLKATNALLGLGIWNSILWTVRCARNWPSFTPSIISGSIWRSTNWSNSFNNPINPPNRWCIR